MIIDDLYYIFDEALKDRKAIVTKTSKVESVIANGIKIQKFADRIEILNMGKGGDYFKECSPEEYQFFYEDGWLIGCYRVKLITACTSLKSLKKKLRLKSTLERMINIFRT